MVSPEGVALRVLVNIMRSIKILAAIEGLLFGIALFCFMLDRNGGPEGLNSIKTYSEVSDKYKYYEDEDEWINPEVELLASAYEDFVGFLAVEGTSISYPVMRDRYNSEGNYYYLTHNYKGEDDRSGCPFIPRSSDLSDDLVTVFAHNNSNGTMFADLSKFDDETFFNEYGRITLDTVNGRMEYEVTSVLDVSVDGGEFTYFGWSNFINDDSERDFIDQVFSLAKISREETIEPGNQYLLLVTCEYSHINGRRIVVALRCS